jgi:hypothetical protein
MKRTGYTLLLTLIIIATLPPVARTQTAQFPRHVFLPAVYRTGQTYLPQVYRPVPPVTCTPKPRDADPWSLVLHLDDMPAGFAVSADDSGPLNLTAAEMVAMGGKVGYQVTYTNIALLFSGTPVIISRVIVFCEADGANEYLGYFENHIDGVSVSTPNLADETLAIQITEGAILGWHIAFRQDNLIGIVSGAGFAWVASFDDVLDFARIAADKF